MYLRNKSPNIEPCDAPYLIVQISDLSLLMVAYLSSVTEVAFEPIKSYSSDAIMVQFRKKDMIDSVKDFLQVFEDTTYKVAREREREQ